MMFVMANTLRELSYDGRFSRQNKDWAEHIEIPENISRGRNLNLDYVIESHPAVLDGFIDMARAEIRMQRIEQAIGENEVTITAETRGYEAEGHKGHGIRLIEKEYAGEKFFLMEHDEFGSDVAGIIVAENGQLVAEDLWNGFDAGALEAVSEYLQENGTTLYDLTEFLERFCCNPAEWTDTYNQKKYRQYRKTYGKKRWQEKMNWEQMSGLIFMQLVRCSCRKA